MKAGEFYYHYDSGTHKGKIVAAAEDGTTENLVDKIICAVHTTTERQDVSPKFVVRGRCSSIILTLSEDGTTAYIS